MSFVAVSENAWEIIREVDYVGYDALKPFDQALQKGEFPYTPYWHGLAALHMATQNLLRQGLEASYAHHLQVAAFCRNGIEALGLTLFPGAGAIPAPTVTAVKVPVEIGWEAFNRQLRSHGLAVGGSYGPLAGRVFRLGHMGTQCDEALVEETLNVIKQVIA
jgi:aspartate aminotransferase-like enzyme